MPPVGAILVIPSKSCADRIAVRRRPTHQKEHCEVQHHIKRGKHEQNWEKRHHVQQIENTFQELPVDRDCYGEPDVKKIDCEEYHGCAGRVVKKAVTDAGAGVVPASTAASVAYALAHTASRQAIAAVASALNCALVEAT